MRGVIIIAAASAASGTYPQIFDECILRIDSVHFYRVSHLDIILAKISVHQNNFPAHSSSLVSCIMFRLYRITSLAEVYGKATDWVLFSERLI